jgi:sulfatase modifying factor 1
MKFVKIIASHFIAGEENEKRLVILTNNFEIQTTTVTQKQWKDIMGSNPSHFKNKPNNPVDSVSWEDCQKFIKRLNKTDKDYIYRLPTEAEWEYCAISNKNGLGWHYENSNQTTQEVGQKEMTNSLGISDMLGNVWEWCEDWYSDDMNNIRGIDPQGAKSGSYCVIRGGSWDYDARGLRSAIRGNRSPGIRSGYVGFRLVRTKK